MKSGAPTTAVHGADGQVARATTVRRKGIRENDGGWLAERGSRQQSAMVRAEDETITCGTIKPT